MKMQQAEHNPGQLRLVTRDGGDERGQSMIEFALTIPIIIITLIAVVGFGWIFYNYVSLNSAVREGAHFVITDPNVTDEEVVARVQEAAWPLNPAQISVTVQPSKGARKGGDLIIVSGTYTINLPTITLPYIITEGSVTLFPPLELQAQARMRID
jgi:hypothetical protein